MLRLVIQRNEIVYTHALSPFSSLSRSTLAAKASYLSARISQLKADCCPLGHLGFGPQPLRFGPGSVRRFWAAAAYHHQGNKSDGDKRHHHDAKDDR